VTTPFVLRVSGGDHSRHWCPLLCFRDGATVFQTYVTHHSSTTLNGRLSGIEAPRPGNSLQKPEKATADQSQSATPSEFKLAQNYPNPFNPTTTIKYDLPVDTRVTSKLYDVLGREVMNLVDGFMPAGYHQVSVQGSTLSSGVYIYKLEAASFTQVRKALIMK